MDKPVSIVSREFQLKKIGGLIDVLLENSNRVPFLERIYYEWKVIPSWINVQMTMVNYQIGLNEYNFKKVLLFHDIEEIIDNEKERLKSLFPEEDFLIINLELYLNIPRKLNRQLNRLKFYRKSFDYRILLISIPKLASEYAFGENVFVVDQFDFDKSNLTREHKSKLGYLSQYIKRTYNQPTSEHYKPVKKILIDGRTDLVGDEKYNFDLGAKRAWNVALYLKKIVRYVSIKDEDVITQGEGDPVINTDQPEGKNRLVGISVVYHLPANLAIRDVQSIVLDVLEQKKNRLNPDFYKQYKKFINDMGDVVKDDKFLTVEEWRSALQFKKEIPSYNDMKHGRQILLKFYYTSKPNDIELYKRAERLFFTLQDFVFKMTELENKGMEKQFSPRGKVYYLNKWEKQLLRFWDLRLNKNYSYLSIFECFRKD
ncbi:OmpA family protein [Maribacter sp. CXY002]|uniref:OmpA family protein n=1 Tax=Maribacter luteocoastalis TaxID=3407671 RepID=UPI003B6766C1